MTGELSVDRVKVFSFKDDKENISAKVRKMTQSNGMMQDQLYWLRNRIRVILREAGDLRLRNLSLEASVGLGLS